MGMRNRPQISKPKKGFTIFGQDFNSTISAALLHSSRSTRFLVLSVVRFVVRFLQLYTIHSLSSASFKFLVLLRKGRKRDRERESCDLRLVKVRDTERLLLLLGRESVDTKNK